MDVESHVFCSFLQLEMKPLVKTSTVEHDLEAWKSNLIHTLNVKAHIV
jgi:hypothetical protein